ncbi:ankyrin repeat domain-containing protein [Brachyspira pulli]|uniref:ankyrin repeat domain-containing protein n=1 Tax=Brachyspira pulli TaxID=310721 RepID=UPI00300458A1
MKKLLLISFILIIVLVISCVKKEEASINNNSMYVSNTDNIYHKTYTNVVKIQGKYVNINSTFYYGNRKEGEYSEDYDIFEAIKNHSLKRVIELIEEGNNINQIHNSDSIYNEFTDYTYPVENAIPLMFAVFYRDLGIMKYLLDNGADPYIKDSNGWNSFLWACGSGNVDVIKMLAEFDSNLVYSKNNYDVNGLHCAAMYDNIEVFEYLVNTFDINSKDKYGNGVLDYVNKDASIEKLKELGAK